MSSYIHGSSSEEQQRLSLLNDILNTASLKELLLQRGNRILDIGSGLGQLTRAMAREVKPEGFVLGIERDPKQLAEPPSCKYLAAIAGHKQRRLQSGQKCMAGVKSQTLSTSLAKVIVACSRVACPGPRCRRRESRQFAGL